MLSANRCYFRVDLKYRKFHSPAEMGRFARAAFLSAWAEQKAVREIMIFLHSHGVGTARAVRKRCCRNRQGGGFGVSFEFDDGWLAARFHLTKAEAERQAAHIGESEPVPHQKCEVGAPCEAIEAIEVR